MFYTTRETKRNILFFAAGITAAFLTTPLGKSFPLRNISTIMYAAILECWVLMVFRRVINPTFRRCMTGGAVSFAVLFFFRVLRYTVVPEETALSRYLWYGYYPALYAVPLFSVLAARASAGNRDGVFLSGGGEPGKAAGMREGYAAVLWALWCVLSAAVLTNDLHGLVFFSDTGMPDPSHHHFGPLYLSGVLWQLVLMAWSLSAMLRCCRRSARKNAAWIPMIPVTCAVVLLSVYAAGGGSPMLFGFKLYQIQEIYLLAWIGFWEVCIQIGLVTSNTGYKEIFAVSGLQAEIADVDGNVVFRGAKLSPEPEDRAEEETAGTDLRKAAGTDCICRSAPVTGGVVRWTEDHRLMNRMNEELSETTRQIEEENELILEENRILEEKTRYGTKNRLYNEISYRTHSQLEELERLVDHAADASALRETLPRCLCLAAYVKQRGNLTILAEEKKGKLSGEDLALAVRELMEYLKLSGAECTAAVEKNRAIPAPRALLFFDLFEEAAERLKLAPAGMLVSFDLRDAEQMTILAEGEGDLPPEHWEKKQIAEQGGSLAAEKEGGEFRIRLSFPFSEGGSGA